MSELRQIEISITKTDHNGTKQMSTFISPPINITSAYTIRTSLIDFLFLKVEQMRKKGKRDAG